MSCLILLSKFRQTILRVLPFLVRGLEEITLWSIAHRKQEAHDQQCDVELLNRMSQVHH